MSRSHRSVIAEPLEPRQLLSAVTWPSEPIDPSDWTYNGFATMMFVEDDTFLRLTPDDIANGWGSVFRNEPRKMDGYDGGTYDFVSFDFMLTGNNGSNGCTFCLQANDPWILGTTSTGLGYEGIPNSMAIKFQAYEDGIGAVSQTGLYFNGEHPDNSRFGGDIDLQPALGSLIGTLWHVDLSYNGSSLTMRMSDRVTRKSFDHSWTVDIPALIGSDTIFPGFTASTSEIPLRQDIYGYNWFRYRIGDPPITGLTDNADTISLKRDGTYYKMLRADGSVLAQSPVDGTSAIVINAKAGNDVITLDYTGGELSVPITINGDAGKDVLKFKGLDTTGKDVTIGNSAVSIGATSIAISGIETVAIDAGASNVLNVKSLTIGSQMSLDIAKGSLVISERGGTTHKQVSYMIASARNYGPDGFGSWTGPGLTSSTAAQIIYPFYTLGTGFDADRNTLVKLVLAGDANLDGMINADDYFAIDCGYITQIGLYFNGDFNYDGQINADDYFLIDSNYLGWKPFDPIDPMIVAPSAPPLIVPQSALPTTLVDPLRDALFSDSPLLE